MKQGRLALAIFLSVALFATLLTGCNSGEADEATDEETEFSYSDGIDDNGYWEGIKALDYVELFDYDHLSIPADVHEITDEALQTEVDSLLTTYATSLEITDRAVADGDTVNMDYVGTIDGVEFSGGNTNGAGTEATIGVSSYVDDFLQQLIGHMPGENFDIEVTFPEDYGNEELNGKNAVFNITLNFISESVDAELSDEFVTTNFSEEHGWTTVKELEDGIRADLQEAAIDEYVQEYLANDVPVSSVPDSLLKYQEDSMVAYYQQMAVSYGMELEELLSTYVGASSVDELVESSHDNLVLSANYSLVIQAIAEDTGLTVSDEEISTYFAEKFGSEDYSAYEESYGKPYLKQVVLGQKVLDRIMEGIELA